MFAHIVNIVVGGLWRLCAWFAGSLPGLSPSCEDATTAEPSSGGLFKGSGFDPSATGEPGSPLWRMAASLLVVVLLGVVAALALRRLRPGLGGKDGKKLSTLETLHLSPRNAVHLLQVGAKKILVASWKDGVAMLDDVTAAVSSDYEDIAATVSDSSDDDQPQQEGEA